MKQKLAPDKEKEKDTHHRMGVINDEHDENEENKEADEGKIEIIATSTNLQVMMLE